jgi:hypothetical protein
MPAYGYWNAFLSYGAVEYLRHEIQIDENNNFKTFEV